MLAWIKWNVLEPPWFWTKYLWFRATRCMWGRHQWTIWNVTDGTVSVRCLRCGNDRAPTADEVAANPASKLTPEEHAARRVWEAEIYEWLEEHGHI